MGLVDPQRLPADGRRRGVHRDLQGLPAATAIVELQRRRRHRTLHAEDRVTLEMTNDQTRSASWPARLRIQFIDFNTGGCAQLDERLLQSLFQLLDIRHRLRI